VLGQVKRSGLERKKRRSNSSARRGTPRGEISFGSKLQSISMVLRRRKKGSHYIGRKHGGVVGPEGPSSSWSERREAKELLGVSVREEKKAGSCCIKKRKTGKQLGDWGGKPIQGFLLLKGGIVLRRQLAKGKKSIRGKQEGKTKFLLINESTGLIGKPGMPVLFLEKRMFRPSAISCHRGGARKKNAIVKRFWGRRKSGEASTSSKKKFRSRKLIGPE